MKKLLFLICLSAIMVTSLNAKAQGITITLQPGWTWISYTNAEAMNISDALGDFAPMEGDIIKAQLASVSYYNGRWRGTFQQFIPGNGYHYYSNRTETVSFVFVGTTPQVTVITSEPTDITATSAVVGGAVDSPVGSHVFMRGVCWGTEPNPDIDVNHTSEGTGIGSYSGTLALNPNITYYVRAYAVTDHGLFYGDELYFTTLEGGSDAHEYVDLGLPSGTLWATCNVGATMPEELGDYLAWGETQPKDYYDWDAYQHCNGGYNVLTKYCNNPDYGYDDFVDNLFNLLAEDDVATSIWGEDWRMPTKQEWEELCNNTTHTWTTQNGVTGRLFTASNGNSIFLPAAGSRYDSYINDVGSNGYYRSNSLYGSDPSNAWTCYFTESDCSLTSTTNRCNGFSVRPVRSTVQSNAPTGAVNGKFTINGNGNQVYFSQGNLQYIGSASTPYWKFAENQWDYLGTTTGQNSSSQDVDRDLFGWGTSGWNSGNTCYQPWDTYTTYGSSYGPLGGNDLTGSYANSDWGVYNPISNGGNQPNQWRTLSRDEWVYVFNTRTTDSEIRFAKANVNNVNGVILLPDGWNSSYYELNETNQKGASYSSNILTASEWNFLERLGAVFLPATGNRFGTGVNNAGNKGCYWSSSSVNATYGYGVYIDDTNLSPQDASHRTYGRGVRLVCVAE